MEVRGESYLLGMKIINSPRSRRTTTQDGVNRLGKTFQLIRLSPVDRQDERPLYTRFG